MDAARFHNALRILLNLSSYELRNSGVIDGNWGTPEASDRDQIGSFIDNPFREAIRMPSANFQRLFALIESRQPKASEGERSADNSKQAWIDAIAAGETTDAFADWWAARERAAMAEEPEDALADAIVFGVNDDGQFYAESEDGTETIVSEDDDGCPKGDPECLGNNGDCHDACEAPHLDRSK